MSTSPLLDRLLRHPCVLIRRTPATPDQYGDPQPDEEHVPAECYAEQINASEPGDPNYQVEQWRFVFAAGTELTGIDAIDIDGARHEVVGPPWYARDPRTNAVHHVELRARSTEP